MMPRAGSPILRGLWMVTLPLLGGARNPVMSVGGVEALPGLPVQTVSLLARGRGDDPRGRVARRHGRAAGFAGTHPPGIRTAISSRPGSAGPGGHHSPGVADGQRPADGTGVVGDEEPAGEAGVVGVEGPRHRAGVVADDCRLTARAWLAKIGRLTARAWLVAGARAVSWRWYSWVNMVSVPSWGGGPPLGPLWHRCGPRVPGTG